MADYDYNALFAEWYGTLIEVAVSYLGVENGEHYKNATQRATGLAELAQRYPEFVKPIAAPTWRDNASRQAQRRLNGREFSAKTTVKDTQRACERLSTFREENIWLETAAQGVTGRQRRFLQNAAQRFRALARFQAMLIWCAPEAYIIQARATVEPEYMGVLLRERPSYHLQPTASQAEAIMMLHSADIPLDYSSAVLTPETLTPTGARQAIGMHTAGIPPEFARAAL